jgi:chromosome segregation ATPase
MRFLPTRFLAVALLPAAAFALATNVREPVARAEEPKSPLEAADRLEQEGRENLEHGHKVEGAKKISEAWRIRAKVWAAEGGEGQPAPEVAVLKEKIEQLRAASGEAERAGHKLKEAGQVEESNAKMEESGRLWRQAQELQQKLEASMQHRPDEGAWEAAARQQRIEELKKQADRAREEAKSAEADAKQADADGKEEAAKAARERTERLRQRVGMLERQIDEAKGGPRAEPPHQDGLGNELRALKAQMEELRRAVDELRRRLEEKPR